MAKGDGLIVMKPTSIVVAGAGSSASINADGGVDFTSATSLSLNGVFTASYTNYVLVINASCATGLANFLFRMRLSGTDAATGYTNQYVVASSTSVTGARASSTYGQFADIDTSNKSGFQFHMYGPAIAQATVYRGVTVVGQSGGRISDYAGTHSTATAYDGLTFIPDYAITGSVVVMGYEE